MARDFFSASRRKVQEQIEQAEREHRRKLFVHRIELARMGIKSYDSGKLADAATHLQAYLKILEEFKGVPEGGLTPSNFDTKKDVAELLLISGVYWDLAKMYDRTKNPKRVEEFHQYLGKFVLFSRNMPFQALCAETVRKYVSLDKPAHIEEFKNAYKQLSVAKCFVATALVGETRFETVERLRSFRDGYLRARPWGRKFIAWYYRNSPPIAERVEKFPRPLRRVLGLVLDGVAALVDCMRRIPRIRRSNA